MGNALDNGEHVDVEFHQYDGLMREAIENPHALDRVDELYVVDGLDPYLLPSRITHTQLLHILARLMIDDDTGELRDRNVLPPGMRALYTALVNKIRSVHTVFVIDARPIERERHNAITLLEWLIVASRFGVRAETIVLIVPDGMRFRYFSEVQYDGTTNLQFGDDVKRLVYVVPDAQGSKKIALLERHSEMSPADVYPMTNELTEVGASKMRRIVARTIGELRLNIPGESFEFGYVMPRPAGDRRWWAFNEVDLSELVVNGGVRCTSFTGVADTDMDLLWEENMDDEMLQVPPVCNFISREEYVPPDVEVDEPDEGEFPIDDDE